MKKIILLVLFLIYTTSNAFATSLSTDEITIKLFGFPLNLTPAVNIKLNFSNPDVAKLDSTPPIFEALGATKLLTEANPETNTITALWDGFIPNDEITIKAMLAPGAFKGISLIEILKVEAVGGEDITDKIAYTIEPDSLINNEGKVRTILGDFSFLGPEEVTGPGKIAVAFKVENSVGNLQAKLNNIPVEFTSNLGITVLNLPREGSDVPLYLEATDGNEDELINLGRLKIIPGISLGLPPRIERAQEIITEEGPKLHIRGRKFGPRRFGHDGTKVEIIPNDLSKNLKKLTRLKINTSPNTQNCLPEGSYVNVSHPAGSDTRKIKVLRGCGE